MPDTSPHHPVSVFPPYAPPPVDDDEHPAPPATLADLTPRQIAVASLLAKGKSDKQIAVELTPPISRQRVAQHVEAIAYLLHCDPAGNVRLQIALWWREQVPEHLTHAA